MKGYRHVSFILYNHMKDEGFHVQIGIDPVTGFVFGGNVCEHHRYRNTSVFTLSTSIYTLSSIQFPKE